MLRLSEVTRNAVATPLYILKRYALIVQTAVRLCVFFSCAFPVTSFLAVC